MKKKTFSWNGMPHRSRKKTENEKKGVAIRTQKYNRNIACSIYTYTCEKSSKFENSKIKVDSYLWVGVYNSVGVKCSNRWCTCATSSIMTWALVNTSMLWALADTVFITKKSVSVCTGVRTVEQNLVPLLGSMNFRETCLWFGLFLVHLLHSLSLCCWRLGRPLVSTLPYAW